MAIDLSTFIPNEIERTAIFSALLSKKNIQIDLLRLDIIHPFISGNKWYKLKYNLQEAFTKQASCIVSFGGAYSNHLHALAYAGKLFNIKTIGLIRGEQVNNNTLTDCKNWGMELHFISREKYRQKNKPNFLTEIIHQFPKCFIIPEGGSNALGRKGCVDILPQKKLHEYTHICCPVGTGTTFAGLINAALPTNYLIGFVALKNGYYLQDEIKEYRGQTNWHLEYDYHAGGFAKLSVPYETFFHDFVNEHHVVLDKVYTTKMMYGIFDMIQQDRIPEGAKILAIHTGGLQGN